MSFVKGLKCKECGEEYPKEPLHVCETCFGPLEASYNYDGIKKVLSREVIESRDRSIWRYKELLPIDEEPTVGLKVGFTPLIKAENLGRALGVKEIYVKNDAVCYPTLSFKDRVVSVALSKAKEFGFKTAACASTGNLANAVASFTVSGNLESYIFIPYDLEQAKIIGTTVYGANLIGVKGTYDDVNRLCSEVAGKFGWAFVNINMRPYYAEGSKSFAFEMMEQLGWRAPKHIVVPMASGSLLTKVWKAIKEFEMLGLVESERYKDLRGSGDGLFSYYYGAQERLGDIQTGKTQHHSQISRDRHARRRVLRDVRHERERGMGRGRDGRGNNRRYKAPGGDRGDIHRNRGRGDYGRYEKAHTSRE